jgi:hypothetical protein
MAYEVGMTTITVEASGDLSGKQFYFGSINSSGQVAVTGAGLAADGVIANKPSAAGQGCAFATHPGQVARVMAGAAVAQGALLQVDANGKAITATTGKVVGKALLAAGADGDIIPALLILQR